MSTSLEHVTWYIQHSTSLTEQEKIAVTGAIQSLSDKAVAFLSQVLHDDPEFVSIFAKNLLAKKDAFEKNDDELFETIVETQQAECN
jgi:hypothetical protein